MKRSIAFTDIVSPSDVSKRARNPVTFNTHAGHTIAFQADIERTGGGSSGYPDISQQHAYITSDNLIDSAANGPLVRYVVMKHDNDTTYNKGDIVWFDLNQTIDIDRRSAYYSSFTKALMTNPTRGGNTKWVAGVFAETVHVKGNTVSAEAIAVADYCELNTNTPLKDGVQYVINTNKLAAEVNENLVGANDHLFMFTVIYGNDSGQQATVCIHS